MVENATGYVVEWRPQGSEADDLVMSMRAGDAAAVQRIAASAGATAFRMTAPNGREAISTPAAVSAWSEGDWLPVADATWPTQRKDRGEAARGDALLEAFLSWSRSQGVLDEAACRRISMAVQMERSGEARGRRP